MIDGRLLTLLTLATTVLAACGSAGSGTAKASPTTASTRTPSASPPPPAIASGPLTISTRSTYDGEALTTLQGFTLYYFTAEKGGVVVCTGSCATTWPPLRVVGPETKPGNVSGTLGTVALADGSTQVTYNGWPLHTYAQDTAQGTTKGQGVGGKWFVATVELTADSTPPAASATPAASVYTAVLSGRPPPV